LRTKLEEALNALHLPIGTYEHAGPNANDPIYAIDFQELRKKIKDAWTALGSSSTITQAYDGDGLRVKKTEYGWTTFYLRSSVLGGQVIAELDSSGNSARGYVYAGSSLMAVQQQGGVFWNYEDPVTKSKRVTDVSGTVVSAIETDPWGADTDKSWSQAFQPRKFTTYDRDGNGSDEAMFRRYNRKDSRFVQPDPYDGSYDAADPQSLNRYAYVQNDPVNFVDPNGLMMAGCVDSEGNPIKCFDPTDYRFARNSRFIGFTGDGGKGPIDPDPTDLPQNPPTQDEMVHCDPNVLKRFEEFVRQVNVSRMGGATGNEYGFRVDKIGGRLYASEIYSSGSATHVSHLINPNTVSVFHSHPVAQGNRPSGKDRELAQGLGAKDPKTRKDVPGYKHIVYTTDARRMTLFNGNNPKDANGKDRILDAPKCP
jgi:RHS repeat-associated protein